MDPYGTVFVGNALVDRTVDVSFDFLAKLGRKPGSTTLIDTFAKVESSWKEAGGDSEKWTIGGSSQNAAQVFKRISESSPVSYLTKRGNDARAETILDRLNEIGIDVLGTTAEAPTGVVNCFVTPDGQRTMEFYSQVAAQFGGADIEEGYFDNQFALHLEGYLGYCGDILERSVEFARKNRLMISLDLSDVLLVQHCSDRLKKLVKDVDYVFGNISEMRMLTGKESVEEITKFFEKGPTVFITDGANGSYVNGAHYPAVKVDDVVDTTGAGDYYIGACLTQIQLNQPVARCVEVASLVAAEVIKVKGTQISDEKWQKLVDFIYA